MRMPGYLLTLLMVGVGLPAVAQAPEQGMQPEDIHRLHAVRDVQVSPDGQSILYTESDSSGSGRATSRLMF